MVVNFPSVAASAVLTADIKKYAQEHCSECTVDSVDVQLSQLANGQSVQTTVSAVQANPEINYVLSAVPSAVTGLSAALQTVGRSNVKIGGTGGEYQNFVNIASGTESAWVNQGTEGVGFNEIDAGLHGLAGGKYQYKSDIYVPLVLVTKSNLAKLGGPQAAKAVGTYQVPANYVDLYSKLWHVKAPK